MIFSVFQKKSGFGVFLVHPPMASVLLSALVERCFVSRMRDFYPPLLTTPIPLVLIHQKWIFCHFFNPSLREVIPRKKPLTFGHCLWRVCYHGGLVGPEGCPKPGQQGTNKSEQILANLDETERTGRTVPNRAKNGHF